MAFQIAHAGEELQVEAEMMPFKIWGRLRRAIPLFHLQIPLHSAGAPPFSTLAVCSIMGLTEQEVEGLGNENQ